MKNAFVALFMGLFLFASLTINSDASEGKSPVFGNASANVLSAVDSSKIVGKGSVADYYGYYGNVYSYYSGLFGRYGYQYDSYSSERYYYYYAYYYGYYAYAFYYYAYVYAGQ